MALKIKISWSILFFSEMLRKNFSYTSCKDLDGSALELLSRWVKQFVQNTKPVRNKIPVLGFREFSVLGISSEIRP